MSEANKPVLSLAAGYHLRAKALCDGRVKLKNFELKAIAFEDDGFGHDQFLEGKFDTGEFSLAMYLALKSRGAPYMAIPVFPNRKFRQSYMFVPENSPLKDPKELKGKKVGIPSWLNTAGLWARGILGDEYGVKPADIHWVMPRANKVDITLPSGTRLDFVAGQVSLAARMLQGEFDAIIVPDFPEEKGWRRLLRDSKAVEQDFFKRTAIFPTSHAITFHAAYLQKHPGAAQEMFDACVEAKNLALRDDADATYSNFVWNRQVWEEQRAVMGPDPWKFGIKGNEKVLNTIVRYAEEQGLLAKKVTLSDLFVQIDEPG
ncbi:MAG: ABC transporter substrate-binding protein [Deltaproteobacteria bacterium]|nr:ABC transporter substrate-binding protein [Deltaproteobacteria bacterium]